MPLEKWSENVVVARLADDPQLTEDLLALDHASQHKSIHAVLDFSGVSFINSSNLAKLLKLRKKMVNDETRLVMCGVGDQVWGTLLLTGLDKLFTVTDDVSTALASVQIR